MLKKVFSLVSVFVLGLLLVACQPKERPTLSFAEKDITLEEGSTYELNPLITNVQGTVAVLYHSNDEAIAKVVDGKIVGVAVGATTIIATLEGYRLTSISLNVNVIARPVITVEKVEINGAKDLQVGEELSLSAVVTTNGTEKGVAWSTSDALVASVDQSGKVTALATGTVVITATSTFDTTKYASVQIVVINLDPTSLFINGAKNLAIGEEITLTAVVSPELASQLVTWSSSDETVVSVTAQGVILAKKAGTAIITAASAVKPEVKNTVEITVTRPAATAMVVNGQNTAKAGETVQLNVTVTPVEAQPELLWSSSDETVATVDATGKVTVLKAGNVTITVKVKDIETVSAAYDMTFTPATPTEVTVTGNANALTGDSFNLTAAVLPANASQAVVWSSSDETVATVDGTGKVTVLKAGNVTITVKVAGYETITKDFVITVKDPVAMIGSTKYASFADAVNAVADGQTIVVLAGTYADNVTFTKDNVTVLGPNKDVNPNLSGRALEAVFTGKWTVASGVDKLTINGLAFTGTAWIDGDGAITGVTFENNYVYNTVEATSTWSTSRVDAKGFMTFWNTAQYGFVGLTVENNKFENVNEANISLARVKDITIKNNTFTNFDRDAIRLDGGYNIGFFNVERNTFANDTLGGYNAIFFRSYGGASTDPAVEVNVTFNTFKNIGQANTTLYSGAFSTNAFQEYSAVVHVDFNTFENCTDYIHVRNNGIRLSTGYTWEATANFNKFIGEPQTYYYRNLNGTTDTTTTNPALMNFDYNYFADSLGNPITDAVLLGAKVKDVASFNNTFVTEADYKQAVKEATIGDVDSYVSADWANLQNGETVVVDGTTLVVGQTAFATLEAAMAAADEEALIYVLPGTYVTDVTITRNNVTVITNNRDIDPNLNTRSAEAVFTGKVTLSEGISNITFNGLAFTQNGYVTAPTGGVTNFTFVYNNFFDSTLAAGNTGMLYFKDVTGTATYKSNYNLVVTNNSFKALNNPRIINVQLVENIYIKSNYFETLNTVAADALRLDKLTATVPVVIEGNEFNKIYQYAIMISNYDVPELRIIGNKFSNIATGGVSVRAYFGTATAQAPAVVNVTYNTFTNVQGSATRVDHTGTTADCVLDVNVNYNIFNDIIPTAYFNNTKGGTAANCDNNYYAGAAADTAKLVGAASYANTYTNINDVPKYQATDAIYPTSVAITNKIAELGRFEEYQLTFEVLPDIATNRKVIFVSSNPAVAKVSATGLVTALTSGTVTITVKCSADETVLDTMIINVTEPARLEADYEGSGAMQIGDAIELTATVYPLTNTSTVVWSTSDPLVAIVDENGVVRATGVGTVVITGKLANDENVNIQIGFTVYGSEVTDDLLKLLINANSGVVLSQNVVYIGSDDGSKDYAHRIYGAVSDYYSASQAVTRNMIPTTSAGYSGVPMTSIEFITIHDTANTGTGSGALANSNWCNNPTNTSGASWHYTVGNDGVYQQVEDEMKAYHAGDGSRAYGLNDTGIFATDLSKEPVLTISADGYFEINGLKTSVVAPTNGGVILTTADIVASGIFITVGTNGNYFINNTWYNTGFSGNIVNMGGNSNSIGIESAVNTDSDVYLTWQKLAKLTADLLVKHNLTTDRVLAHNNFSGKVCPRTMLTAGLWDEFMSLVEVEYQVKKNYSDYTITFESMNAEIIDNTGRIIRVPAYTTNVSYKVTVTKGEFTQSVVLNALVKGSANW